MADDDNSQSDYSKSIMGKLKAAFAPANARAEAAIAERHADPSYNSNGLAEDMQLSKEERVKKFRKGFLGETEP